MLLNDIGSTPTATINKINQHLETNYGFKISESSKDKDLVAIMETIEGEITDLKLKGEDARQSPEISKRLLVLEGIKTLREYAVIQLQSPKLEPVIAALVTSLVTEFNKSGDFETEMANALNAYRSSEFRFPEDYIAKRVRDDAMKHLSSPSTNSILGNDMDEEVADDSMLSGEEDMVTELARELGKHRVGLNMPTDEIMEDDIEETEGGRDRAQQYSGDFKMSPNTARNQLKKDDPWAAQAAARRGAGIVHEPAVKKQVNQGKNMRENQNLVRQLRTLLETEVIQAEVMIAAKGFAEELQEMVEKIGRLQNEDLPPVTDQMRETYGMAPATAFQTQIYGAFQSVMDALYTAKDQVDEAVSNMATNGQYVPTNDMDAAGGMDAGMDAGMGDEMGADLDIGDEPDADLDNIGEPEDEFGGAETEEPLGRNLKETALKKKVSEMKRLVAKARALKEVSK